MITSIMTIAKRTVNQVLNFVENNVKPEIKKKSPCTPKALSLSVERSTDLWHKK